MHSLVPSATIFASSSPAALKTRWNYAKALYGDADATLDDLREAVRTLEETERTARRVLGASHPTAVRIGRDLKKSRVANKAWYSSKALVVLFAVAVVAWLWRFLT